MQIFKNRPLACFAVTLSICALWAYTMKEAAKEVMCLGLLVAALLAVLVSFFLRHARRLLPLLLGALLAFSSSFLYFDVFLAERQTSVGMEIEIEGVIEDRTDATEFSSSFGVKLRRIGDEKSRERVVLSCEYPSAMQVGDVFCATVTQSDFAKNGSFDELRYYGADGYTRVFQCFAAEHCTIMEHGKGGAFVRLKKWNATLSSRLTEVLGKEEGAFASAVLLGNRTELSDETQMQFRRVGISHLLALSGLHVSILVGALELLLRRLRVGRMIRAGVLPCVLIGYLALTGFSPSAVRAVVMVCILYLGFLLRADYDSLTALAAILAVMLFLTPYAVQDLSMWMSFLAAGAIIVFYPWIRAMGSRIRGESSSHLRLLRRMGAIVFEAFMIGVVATASLLWLSAEVFGSLSVLAVPATLLFAVPLSAFLILSAIVLLIPFLPIVAVPCRWLAHGMLWGASSLSAISDVDLAVGSVLETILLLLLSAFLVVLAIGKCRCATVLLLVPILTASVYGVSALQTECAARTYISAEESGCGFAMLSENGELIAVDFDVQDSGDVAAFATLARQNRCTELDELLLTDYDNRRAYVLHCLAERIPVRRLRLMPPQNDRERAVAARIEEEALRYGIEVRYNLFGISPELGDPYQWSLYPPIFE